MKMYLKDVPLVGIELGEVVNLVNTHSGQGGTEEGDDQKGVHYSVWVIKEVCCHAQLMPNWVVVFGSHKHTA